MQIEQTVEEQSNKNGQLMEVESTTAGHTVAGSDCVAHKRLTPKATVNIMICNAFKLLILRNRLL